jgi:MFS family permease
MNWSDRRIPDYATALLNALQFSGARQSGLAALGGGAWTKLLAFSDRTQLTLLLEKIPPDLLPPVARERLQKNLAGNRERIKRIFGAYREIASVLREGALDFLTLKGFTQYPDFIGDLIRRTQYDVDIFCPPDRVAEANESLVARGYEPLEHFESFPTDHLPTLVRKTGWQWRGDFFDPEIPVSIDLHFRFWDETTERIAAPGVEEFWERRTVRTIEGLTVTVLHPADALGYSCLHMLRHLLRGSVRPYQAYEIAHFLEDRSGDDSFWRLWHSLHPPGLRSLQAVCFGLAERWFECSLADAAREECDACSPAVRDWIRLCAASPVEGLFRPNKDEILLHLNLVGDAAGKRHILCRRLLPTRLPGPVDAVYLPQSKLTFRLRLRRCFRYGRFLAKRATHHARALLSLAGALARWRLRGVRIDGGFRAFLAAASLFNLGMFVFVLLYNLYLLDAGFDERLLGWLAGSATLGSLAAALPSGMLLTRLGLRKTFTLCFAGTTAICVLKTLLLWPPVLIPLSFLGGALFALWGVAIAPTIAALRGEPRRARAFSLFFSVSIALGIAGGWVGGRLPAWFSALVPSLVLNDARRLALLAGCALAGLALWPARRLRPLESSAHRVAVYPKRGVVIRYLIAFGVWNLATGAFNPFFNAYFSRGLGAGDDTVGAVFSAAQMAQLVALSAAPILFRRLGLINGISTAIVATAFALLAMATKTSVPVAAACYAAFMALQWMSEPGMNTFLMNSVPAEERAGASAMAFTGASLMQAAAAFSAGTIITHWGYSTLLVSAALVATLAGLLVRTLLAGATEATQSLRESAPESAPP